MNIQVERTGYEGIYEIPETADYLKASMRKTETNEDNTKLDEEST